MPSPPLHPRSWIHSREARLWEELSPGQAGHVMRGAFGERAGAEALLRGYLAALDGKP